MSSTAGQVISGFTQDLTKLPALKNVLGDTLDTSTPIPERQFNPFNPVDAHGARVMASKLIELADSAGADGLAVAAGVTDSFSALLGGVGGLVPGLGGQLMTTVTTGTAEIAREIVNTVGQNVLGRVGLSEHALMLFITHYPSAHQQISLDPFDVREPNLVSRLGSKAWPAEENQLNFWREDALLNDHHGRWHDVNPWQGRPTEPGKTYQRASHPIIGDRNGELFSYMHMQMLARYDAERLAMDLDRVEPFDDYDAEIPQGYKPGDRMGKKVKDGFYVYRERPPGVKLTSLTSEPSEDLNDLLDNVKKFDKALNEAASQGYFLIPDQGSENNIAVTDDNLGNTVQG
ncbi:MAG: hypothetical protein ACREQV_01930, partial [Candidatus Binatia bacterium]